MNKFEFFKLNEAMGHILGLFSYYNAPIKRMIYSEQGPQDSQLPQDPQFEIMTTFEGLEAIARGEGVEISRNRALTRMWSIAIKDGLLSEGEHRKYMCLIDLRRDYWLWLQVCAIQPD